MKCHLATSSLTKSLLFLTLTSSGAFQSFATLAFYDAFDYTPSQLLAPLNDTTGSPNPGQHNIDYNVDWRYAGAGGSVNNSPGIASGGLSYAGLTPGTGNSVGFDTTQLGSARVQVTSTPLNSGLVFWSGLLQVNSIGSLTTGANGMLLGGFNNVVGPGTLPGSVGAVLRIRQDSSDSSVYHIGTAMNSGTGAGNIQFDNTTPHSAGQTVFVVAAYEFIAGANNDAAYMWINPDNSTFGAGSAPTPTLSSAPGGTIADSFASLSTFNLRNVNTVGSPALRFDELRVGTTWADVTPAVPEPAGVLLGGIAGIGLLINLRSRRA